MKNDTCVVGHGNFKYILSIIFASTFHFYSGSMFALYHRLRSFWKFPPSVCNNITHEMHFHGLEECSGISLGGFSRALAWVTYLYTLASGELRVSNGHEKVNVKIENSLKDHY